MVQPFLSKPSPIKRIPELELAYVGENSLQCERGVTSETRPVVSHDNYCVPSVTVQQLKALNLRLASGGRQDNINSVHCNIPHSGIEIVESEVSQEMQRTVHHIAAELSQKSNGRVREEHTHREVSCKNNTDARRVAETNTAGLL